MVNLQTMQQMVYFNKVTLTFCKTVVQFSIDNYINTSGATSGAGTAYPSGAPEFIPGFQWGLCYSIFSFMCLFCSWLFVLFLLVIVLSVLFLLVIVLSVLFLLVIVLFVLFLLVIVLSVLFRFTILITPLVSSNSSYI
jgi:hypothetical protein